MYFTAKMKHMHSYRMLCAHACMHLCACVHVFLRVSLLMIIDYSCRKVYI